MKISFSLIVIFPFFPLLPIIVCKLGKLYFLPREPRGNLGETYDLYNMKRWLVYESFFADFGPINLGRMVAFCRDLQPRLLSTMDKPILGSHYYIIIGINCCFLIVWCEDELHTMSNTVVMLGSFMIICLNKSVYKSFQPFSHLPLIPFR